MDKKGNKRSDRYQQHGGRGRGFGTLRDIAPRQRGERRDQQQQWSKPQKTGGERTRCEHCSGPLRPCGAVGRAGHLRWKCRKCGRTIWIRPDFKPPVPIVPVSKVGILGG